MPNINLLSANRASVESALQTGTTVDYYWQNVTATSSTDWAADGTRSLKAVCDLSSTAAYVAIGNYYGDAQYRPIPVKPSTQYTFTCTIRSTDQTGISYAPIIRWFNAALTGTYQAQPTGVNPTSTGAVYTTTATSPSDAVWAAVIFEPATAPILGTAVYFDKLGFWEGSDTTWSMPINLLSENQKSGGDYLANITGFEAGTGLPAATLTYNTTQRYSGAGSIQAAITGAAAAQGVRCTIPAGTLTAGTYVFSFWYRVSNSTAYTVSVVNNWDGSWLSDAAARAANTWIYAEHTQVVSTSAAGQTTYVGLGLTDAGSAATIWVDDFSVSAAAAPVGTPVTYGRLITIGG